MILDGFGLDGENKRTKHDIAFFLIIPEFQGQLKLRDASVVVVGAGGLGCPALQYLGSSGIGSLP